MLFKVCENLSNVFLHLIGQFLPAKLLDHCLGQNLVLDFKAPPKRWHALSYEVEGELSQESSLARASGSRQKGQLSLSKAFKSPIVKSEVLALYA